MCLSCSIEILSICTNKEIYIYYLLDCNYKILYNSYLHCYIILIAVAKQKIGVRSQINKLINSRLCIFHKIYLTGNMPQLKTLFTISLRCVARNMKIFWKKEWDPELEKITELSDEILLRLRKN